MPRSVDAGFGDARSSLAEAVLVLDDVTVDVAAVRSPSFSARGQPVAAINVIKKTAAAAVAFFNMHKRPCDVPCRPSLRQSSTMMY